MAHFPVIGGDKGPRSPSVHLCSTSWNLKKGPCTGDPCPPCCQLPVLLESMLLRVLHFKGPGSKRDIHSTGFLQSDWSRSRVLNSVAHDRNVTRVPGFFLPDSPVSLESETILYGQKLYLVQLLDENILIIKGSFVSRVLCFRATLVPKPKHPRVPGSLCLVFKGLINEGSWSLKGVSQLFSTLWEQKHVSSSPSSQEDQSPGSLRSRVFTVRVYTSCVFHLVNTGVETNSPLLLTGE